MVEIQYTDDKEKLYPKVRKVSAEEKFQQYLNDGMIENGKLDLSYSFAEIGKYKRKEWEFQKNGDIYIRLLQWG